MLLSWNSCIKDFSLFYSWGWCCGFSRISFLNKSSPHWTRLLLLSDFGTSKFSKSCVIPSVLLVLLFNFSSLLKVIIIDTLYNFINTALLQTWNQITLTLFSKSMKLASLKHSRGSSTLTRKDRRRSPVSLVSNLFLNQFSIFFIILFFYS